MKKAAIAKEKDFQTQTNEYARHCIETMREDLDSESERENLTEQAVEVAVRSDWYQPGDASAAKPTEYFILLGTGGPASRIRGELDEYCQPSTAEFEYQDWFKPWTAADNLTNAEKDTLLEFAQQFYFGD